MERVRGWPALLHTSKMRVTNENAWSADGWDAILERALSSGGQRQRFMKWEKTERRNRGK